MIIAPEAAEALGAEKEVQDRMAQEGEDLGEPFEVTTKSEEVEEETEAGTWNKASESILT